MRIDRSFRGQRIQEFPNVGIRSVRMRDRFGDEGGSRSDADARFDSIGLRIVAQLCLPRPHNRHRVSAGDGSRRPARRARAPFASGARPHRPARAVLRVDRVQPQDRPPKTARRCGPDRRRHPFRRRPVSIGRARAARETLWSRRIARARRRGWMEQRAGPRPEARARHSIQQYPSQDIDRRCSFAPLHRGFTAVQHSVF